MTQRCFWLGTGVVFRPMGPKITILLGAAREVQPTVRDAKSSRCQHCQLYRARAFPVLQFAVAMLELW